MQDNREILAERLWDLLRRARILEAERPKSFAQLTGPSKRMCLDWAEFLMLDMKPLLEALKDSEKLLAKAADHLHAANQILLHEQLIDDDLDYLDEEAVVSELRGLSLKIGGLLSPEQAPERNEPCLSGSHTPFDR